MCSQEDVYRGLKIKNGTKYTVFVDTVSHTAFSIFLAAGPLLRMLHNVHVARACPSWYEQKFDTVNSNKTSASPFAIYAPVLLTRTL